MSIVGGTRRERKPWVRGVPCDVLFIELMAMVADKKLAAASAHMSIALQLLQDDEAGDPHASPQSVMALCSRLDEVRSLTERVVSA